MKPQEKAKELVNEFCHSAISDKHQIEWAKMNAIKCIKKIIELLEGDWSDVQWVANEKIDFYNKVKEEINKI